MDKKQKKAFKFRLVSEPNSKAELVSDATETKPIAEENKNELLQQSAGMGAPNTKASPTNSSNSSLAPDEIPTVKPKTSSAKMTAGFANIILFALAAVSAFLAPTFWLRDAMTFNSGVVLSICLGTIVLIAVALVLRGKSHFENPNYSLPLGIQKLFRFGFLGISAFVILAAGLPILGFTYFCIEKQNLLNDRGFAKESTELKHKKWTALCDRSIAISAYNPMMIALSAYLTESQLNDPATALEYFDRPSLISKSGELGDSIYRAKLLYQIPGRRAEAEAIFSKMEAKTNDWELQSSLCHAFTGLKLYHRALAAANNFVRLRPEYSGAYLQRSDLYKALGEDSKAKEDLVSFKKLTR